jgi:hypothetical protein
VYTHGLRSHVHVQKILDLLFTKRSNRKKDYSRSAVLTYASNRVMRPWSISHRLSYIRLLLSSNPVKDITYTLLPDAGSAHAAQPYSVCQINPCRVRNDADYLAIYLMRPAHLWSAAAISLRSALLGTRRGLLVHLLRSYFGFLNILNIFRPDCF